MNTHNVIVVTANSSLVSDRIIKHSTNNIIKSTQWRYTYYIFFILVELSAIGRQLNNALQLSMRPWNFIQNVSLIVRSRNLVSDLLTG